MDTCALLRSPVPLCPCASLHAYLQKRVPRTKSSEDPFLSLRWLASVQSNPEGGVPRQPPARPTPRGSPGPALGWGPRSCRSSQKQGWGGAEHHPHLPHIRCPKRSSDYGWAPGVEWREDLALTACTCPYLHLSSPWRLPGGLGRPCPELCTWP